MEMKKISFGFTKKQAPGSFISKNKLKEEPKIELIKCLEEQSIVVANEKPKEEKRELIIPLKNATRTSAALASLKRRQDVLNNVEVKEEDKLKSESNADKEVVCETLEQKAAKELLQETKNDQATEENEALHGLSIKADELPLDGGVEPTLADYEDVPISAYGLAMLRGMGFTGDLKKIDEQIDISQLRPKGMGLGADKMIRAQPLLIPPEKNEELILKKNACIRMLTGKYKDLYGQIESLDDHASRVLVKLALGGKREWFNEFMMQPVSKKEYSEYGKVLNSAKYEQYKKIQEQQESKVRVKMEENVPSVSSNPRVATESDKILDYETNHRTNKHKTNRDRSNRHRSDSESDSRNHATYESDHSQSGKTRSRKKHRKSPKQKKARSSSSDDDKRHKKKTKKSKKQRSRSRGRR